MDKKFLLIVLVCCLFLSSCGKEESISSVENSDVNSSHIESEEVEDKQEYMYFETDAVIDDFFVEYNSLAEIPIASDEIEKGNIRSKALVNIGNLNLEVVNTKETIALSVETAPEDENTVLFALFRDCIKAAKPDFTELDIQSAWDDIHKTGYMVEDFNFNGISITYVPSKKLSQGVSNLRVDIEIPVL